VPKSLAELDGLVYGATKIPAEDPVPFYKNEWFWTATSVAAFVALNVYFW
jgi:SSS family solute:Na+ symporter